MSALELRIPPLLLTLLFAALMWLATTLLPSPDLSLAMPWRLVVAGLPGGAGLVFVVAGVAAFRRARTTVDPARPGNASAVVASGIYGISRNPMYVGFLLLLAGWGVLLGHGLAYALVPACYLYLDRFQVQPEERILRERFGGEYAAYLQAVRRWL